MVEGEDSAVVDGRQWLAHARSDLALARIEPPPGVRLEALCFHAQQAAEKALKALLIARRIEFPRTHNLRILLDLLPTEIAGGDDLGAAAGLTDYAVTTRYPGLEEPVLRRE